MANEAGAELARRLALAIGEIRAGAEELNAAPTSRASLRVGVLALAPRSLLAKAADAVLADNGPPSIEVVEGPYSQIIRNLHDGALDVIFGALRAPPPFDELIEEPLFEDPYTIVCRRGHPLTHLAQAGAEDLAQFGWVHPTADLPRRAVLDQITAEWGLNQNINFETNCLATITALLSASDRLSILSLRHIEIDQRLERVNHPPIQHETRHVGLTIRKNWLPTPFQLRFIDHMRHLGEKFATSQNLANFNSARNKKQES
jgi:DNA-binding transcriptional LysR family regulator